MPKSQKYTLDTLIFEFYNLAVIVRGSLVIPVRPLPLKSLRRIKMGINELFGSMVFNDAVMCEKLPVATYREFKKCCAEGRSLTLEMALENRMDVTNKNS